MENDHLIVCNSAKMGLVLFERFPSFLACIVMLNTAIYKLLKIKDGPRKFNFHRKNTSRWNSSVRM